uniref:Selenoprotein T n=1 Tax=Romanomermis culicivorax TaxID=13658 RepID=A0A915HZE3_ROMCU
MLTKTLDVFLISFGLSQMFTPVGWSLGISLFVASMKLASFEVKINGQLVYSKLEKGSFPDYDAIVKMVIEADEQ